MYMIRMLVALLVAAALSACGGGGGSPGATPTGGGGGNGSTPGTTTTTVPTLSVALLDASNNPTTSVSASGVTTARATLQDASGHPVAGKVVAFSGDAALVKLNPASGQVLTDSSGIAAVQITPASLSAAGAGTLKASAAVGTTQVTGSFDFQLSAANLALQNLNLGAGAVPAYGNRAITVGVTVNGVPATNTPVQVTFSASCGSITPATVTTDSTGTASSTYKADNATCAGSNVTLSASAVGATALSGTVPVAPSLATNVQFIGAAPQLIYLTGSVGATQAQVSFKVVDSSGNPLQNQQVQLSIVNSAPGVSLNAVGNTAPVTLTSDAAGLVNVAVFSGTVPTSVQIRAILANNSTVAATSNVLTVASGRPVQRAMSVALSKFSIEGWNVDGATSHVTVSLADRQGNPVPQGTQVNFTTKYGLMIPASCVVDASSSCAVDIRSQGDRSAPFVGRVAILAYVPGEEDFVDLNGNNVYDPNEPFTDLGNAYRDEYTAAGGVANGTYDVGEFIVPRAGNATCAGGLNGVPNTCDGVWGTADVRVQSEVIFASSQAFFDTPTASTAAVTVSVADVNGNSMPSGSAITAEKLSGSSNCTVTKVNPSTIPNTYGPTTISVLLNGCLSKDVIGITLTTPGGPVSPTATLLSVPLP
jgi:hypothetical protein